MRETAAPEHITQPGKVAAWTILIAGFLLLTFAAALRADARTLNGRATRKHDFNATGAIRSLTVENVNGDITITSGPAFKAAVELTARGEDDADARKALERTEVHFQNENGELTLSVEPKGSRRAHGRWNWSDDDENGWRVDARCTITVPKDASIQVSTVNGKVSSEGISGEQEIGTVNGTIIVAGARNALRLNTVNGGIDGTFADLPRTADIKAETVNGSIVLRLPAKSGFSFKGHTMSGRILTTFPLPASEDEAEMERSKEEMRAARERVKADRDRIREEARKEREKARKEREKAREKAREKGEDAEEWEPSEVDLSELNQAMRELDRELSNMSREISRSVTMSMNRAYEGTVGGGGASVHCSTLNGKIVLLQEGTKEEDAKALVSGRRAHVVTIPPVPPLPPLPRTAVRIQTPPSAPVPPAPPAAPAPRAIPRHGPMAGLPGESGSIVKGDISGDFYASLPMGDITLGKVSGRVKASTQSGEIRVAEAGAGADLFSSGGDVAIEAVTGELKARTYGGDMRVGRVSGDATLDTAGGDIVVRSAGGSVNAQTGGGDVRLEKVRGPVRAQTGGGSVTCEIASPSTTADLQTGGGDVTLTLPANFKGEVEVRVNGVDSDGNYILSDFPELSVSRRHGSQSASGKLNGGGPKVSIRTSSGTVSLRKGPAA